ncbi:glycoside hydrolase family 38 C-terminal domain-containing protein [Paenibacillus qinlingensis]|uniref:Alpha-mannosidase n=1 Tax=Paenibacillus qinlingensis TaxID=1837343 RepID=A0ABU1NXL4_9BACL|nr:glycoside hydrolase family 38 C-terminal domain-containing protein [Paenibacillus qinlingensis]MDR6552243.1 alpha-mannosidase [Paenibacillus qinlingensis]
MTVETKLHLIGNAHLDPVWLWRWQEGYAEIKATFRSALDRLNEFPDFVFTCACAAYYKWIEENAPEMFAEIKERVAEGRWVITGGWWIQPDCNLPSGESFARHSLYGQRYFLQKFGVMANVGYNVDSFGHHGMMPQILKQSGMDSYVFMRPEAHEKALPHDLFWWESEDGSRVMTFRLSNSYGNWAKNGMEDKIVNHRNTAISDGHAIMSFYGVGNHGGGPTIENIHLIHEIQQRPDMDGIRLSSPNHYFKEMMQIGPDIPVVKDEMQMHAVGCYSTHSESKAANRRVEHRMLTAEKFATLANIMLGLPYPLEALNRAWENVMFNHFHDIMGGCSIKEAYSDVQEFYGESLSIGAKSINAALQKMSWSINTMKPGVKSLNKEKDWQLWEQGNLGTPLVVFNPLSWEVEAPIAINKKLAGVTDAAGNPLPLQTVRAPQTNIADKWDTLISGRIPAFGYQVFWAYRDQTFETKAPEGAAHTSGCMLENNQLYVELHADTGYIKRIIDKRNGFREVFAGDGAVPIVLDETHSDTWGHGLAQYRDEIGRFNKAELKVIEEGPLRATIRVISHYGNSVLRQDISLLHDSADVHVKVKLDWREQHKMLKLAFPVNVTKPRAIFEIPYGFIERQTNGHEVPGQIWVNVSGQESSTTEGNELSTFGLSLINDTKYAYDVLGNELRITVVRSPIYADHFGERDDQVEFMDQGVQEFNYVLSPHAGSWQDSGVVRKAYELHAPLMQIWETYHEGALQQVSEGITISSDNVIAVAFKPAEEGNGWILRCQETYGREAVTQLSIPTLNRSWQTTFGKCEIKTFFIPNGEHDPIQEVNFVELTKNK